MATGPVVLALEFHAVRKTADFSFLRSPDSAGHLVRIDPLDDHLAERLSVERQSHLLLERLPAAPSLVLSYCACAALAVHTAALCDADVLLVDPDVVDPVIMRRDYLQLCQTLAVDPSPLTDWEAVFSAARDRLAADYGGDEEAYDMVDDLFERYRSWARFLEASLDPVPADPKGDVRVISGQQLLPDLSVLLARPARAEVRRIEPSADTLGLPEVRDLVREVFDRVVGNLAA